LSLDALNRASELFAARAKERLDGSLEAGAQDLASKKGLIDQSLAQISDQMKEQLARVNETIRLLEKDREGKFADLAAQMAQANTTTQRLADVTSSLRETLSSSKARGTWGERMAEDVLRLAGFEEGINYRKQTALPGSRQRPDFTFLLPNDLVINMDVKFPLDNYVRYLDAATAEERARCRDEFVRDARASVKQIATRDYIDPEARTLDCVLLFIPNEQVYGFLHEVDRTFVDDAAKKRVILCSPFTLYAVLALIRAAFDSFHVQRTSGEILEQLGKFQVEWERFKDQMDKMGRRIDDAQKAYAELVTTRVRALERPLGRIDDLRAPAGDAGVPTDGLFAIDAIDEALVESPEARAGGRRPPDDLFGTS
jgi:DNA recombination protein RmuC